MHTAKPASESLFEPSMYTSNLLPGTCDSMFNNLDSNGVSGSFAKQSRSPRHKNSSCAPERHTHVWNFKNSDLAVKCRGGIPVSTLSACVEVVLYTLVNFNENTIWTVCSLLICSAVKTPNHMVIVAGAWSGVMLCEGPSQGATP
ncbi:hypothetical protein AVEN_204899-1 [Araneus ventricosus]|uniref:Uncharacterized protein n=1 Tax=Araneus ventricosus TaxID=182803 RepID=A0A4Y2NZE1_ARAVE|nr:hypothetical protein AVEN_204899-1 [Araneus ventricosus]